MVKGNIDAKQGTSHDPAKGSSGMSSNILPVAKARMDPNLAALFRSSARPVKVVQLSQSHGPGGDTIQGLEHESKSQLLELSSAHPTKTVDTSEIKSNQTRLHLKGRSHHRLSRKRALKDAQDDLEESYLDRLAREEAREDRHRQSDASRKRRKIGIDHNDTHGSALDDKESSIERSGQDSELGQDDTSFGESDEEVSTAQKHGNESQIIEHDRSSGLTGDIGFEKASRTVFVGNVCTSTIKSKTAKSTFMQHLVSFVTSLPPHTPAHKVESLRFRSTPFSTSAIPKKAAFAKKELMDATTKSTNAYVVYSTPLAAREAVRRLNGSLCLDRHIRVDSVAHPSKTDHKRCVFVGNLGFVDNPQAIDAAKDEENQKKPRKPREPADIEEGLWRIFGRSGKVESVRVIRDPITRVGKGFAYVQFEDPNSVEKALLFAGKKFPPMLPRILRVTRAKNVGKTASGSKDPKNVPKPSRLAHNAIHISKPDPQQQSLRGRAGKLFGRAGAAKLRGTGSNTTSLGKRGSAISGFSNKPFMTESVIFEGHRASSMGKKGVKVLPRKGKPQTRSSKRATAFRSGGFKTKRAKTREQRAKEGK